MRLDFKNTSTGSRGKRSKLSLKFTLLECNAELDISVVDRISALICPDLPCYSEPVANTDMEVSI